MVSGWPLVTEDEFNALSWRDFLLWAITQPDIRAAFTRATGLELDGQSHVFTRWATETLYGMDRAPKAYREAVR